MKKLDIGTKMFLYFTNAKILVPNYQDEMVINESNPKEVYIFYDYDDYVNYYKNYIKKIDKKMINKAIYTYGKNGQVIAFKGLCEKIIIRQKIEEFYNKYDKKKIDEIHSKGKITPFEKVEEYESWDLCAPGDAIGSASNRCKFFSNCHECLLEYASHNNEYDRIDFKLIDHDIDENKKVLKKNV